MIREVLARGRLPAGVMNRTEASYAQHLKERQERGEILAFWFEAIKLKVAENACSYTPDFLVMLPDGTLELHEVKGSMRIFTDDAKVKCKVCASTYPFPLFVVFPRPKKEGGGWGFVEFSK